jgi:hypothetical protein
MRTQSSVYLFLQRRDTDGSGIGITILKKWQIYATTCQASEVTPLALSECLQCFSTYRSVTLS